MLEQINIYADPITHFLVLSNRVVSICTNPEYIEVNICTSVQKECCLQYQNDTHSKHLIKINVHDLLF